MRKKEINALAPNSLLVFWPKWRPHVAFSTPSIATSHLRPQGPCKATSKQLPEAEDDVSSALSLCFFVMGGEDERGPPDSLAVSQGERLPGWLAEAPRERVKHEEGATERN